MRNHAFIIALSCLPVFGIFNGPVAGISNVNRPSLTLEHVENRYDTFALYISYTGGHDRPKHFYYRDSLAGDVYRLLPIMWGSDKSDAVGVMTDEEHDSVLGHRMKLKVYFDRAALERDVYINVIDENGNADTPPVHFKLSPREAKPLPRIITRTPVTAAPKPKPVTPEKFRTYADIAERTGGELIMPRTAADIPKHLYAVIDKTAGGDIDVVFVIDDTGSMADDAAVLKENISAILDALYKKHSSVRTGLLLYRDYSSEFLTKPFPFTTKRDEFIRNLNTMKTTGGDDEPEAVLEAIEAALTAFDLKASKRVIIVMGDAPPHERSLAKVDAIIESTKADGVDVKVFLLGLPGDAATPQKDAPKAAVKKVDAVISETKPPAKTAPKKVDAVVSEPKLPVKTEADTATTVPKKDESAADVKAPKTIGTATNTTIPRVDETTAPGDKTLPAATNTTITKPSDTGTQSTPTDTKGADNKGPATKKEAPPDDTKGDGMGEADNSTPKDEGAAKKDEPPVKAEPKKEEPKKETPPPATGKKPAVRSPDNADW
ncbi:MAG: VWA domain-containing protein [Spirochaetota bacterium]